MPKHHLLLARHRGASCRRSFDCSPAPLLARIWRSASGASAVELALLLPVFLTFLLGIEEFGRALWTQVSLQFAVEAAARCAATTCAADIRAYAATKALGLTIPSSAFTYDSAQSCGIAGYTFGNQVTASYNFPSLVGTLKFLPRLDLTLRAKSCRP